MKLDTITTVYIGNGLGLLLMLVLFISNRGRLARNRETKIILGLLLIAAISCVADPVVYTVDGKPGIVNTVLIYLGNSWLYLANMFTGIFWVEFIADHLNIQLSRRHQWTLNTLSLFGCICLIINLFYPIVFSAPGNIYKRSTLFWMYLLIAFIHMVDSVFIYMQAKRAGGLLLLFPIGIFIIPVMAGAIIQSMFYGVSVVWACVGIGLAGVLTALKNEIIFRDRLTGLFNRAYLDQLLDDTTKGKTQYVTGIMIDLNGFKSINDRFGHATGDEALIIASDIFRMTVGALGSVIRYAGDEFVVLLNTVDEIQVELTINNLRAAFEAFNQSGEKPYRLSAAMGYAAFDLKNQSMNDFMNNIDQKMYEDKAAYYARQKTAEH